MTTGADIAAGNRYRSRWARRPRPARRLGSVGKVRPRAFEGPMFQADCREIAFDNRKLLYVISNQMAAERVQTLFTKEPTTIPWLETFAEDDVFFDIGANVGMYSVYAGATTGCRVYAFEPEALNYAELNKNIFVNGLHERVKAYNIAISNEMRVGELFLGGFGYAHSHHDFNENTWAAEKQWNGGVVKREDRLHQGCLSFAIDDLIEKHSLPIPNHIKVDVDGLERRVFESMRRTLQSKAVKTCLIEIDFSHPDCAEIIDEMTAMGWRHSMSQLRANRKKILSEDDIRRMRRHNKWGLNYIFFRDDFYEEFFARFLDNYTPPWGPPRASLGSRIKQTLRRLVRPDPPAPPAPK